MDAGVGGGVVQGVGRGEVEVRNEADQGVVAVQGGDELGRGCVVDLDHGTKVVAPLLERPGPVPWEDGDGEAGFL